MSTNQRLVDKIPYNQAYSPNNFETSLSIPEIDVFRKRLLQNIGELNLNRHRIRTDDFNQLMNYHQYTLNTLDNMTNVKYVEMNNPYNQNMKSLVGGQAQPGLETLNPYENSLKVIYKRDGTTQIISRDDYAKKFKAEWESQFNESLINPPSESMPPNNCWALPNIR
jgi:hypothetical protein